MRFALEQNRRGWKMREPAATPGIGLKHEESLMTHDAHDSHGEHAQATFLGWCAVGLLVFMGVFTLGVLGAAAMYGFS
jgi:hypothetical protein